MFTNFYLSYCGFQFDGRTDVDRRDVEMFLQQRNQGIKPGSDYLFQPLQNGWQVSGISPVGARAVCSVAQGLKKIPNRLDVTMAVVDNFATEHKFYSYASKLISWFQVNKPKINVSSMASIGTDQRMLFGSKNSRWCLWLSEHTDPVQPFGGYQLEVTFTTRNENCVALWDYFVVCGTDHQFQDYSKEAFEACTNTILGPDFFGLGLSKEPFLRKEKKVTEDKDWNTYLSTVAGKILAHYKMDPNASTERDLSFIKAQIAARASKDIPFVVQ